MGPFIYNGPRVIEAALAAGCHYLDISGEQAWIRQIAEQWSLQIRGAGTFGRSSHCIHVGLQ